MNAIFCLHSEYPGGLVVAAVIYTTFNNINLLREFITEYMFYIYCTHNNFSINLTHLFFVFTIYWIE